MLETDLSRAPSRTPPLPQVHCRSQRRLLLPNSKATLYMQFLIHLLILASFAFENVQAQGVPPGGREVTVESMIVGPTVLRRTVKAVGTVEADASAVLRAELPGQVLALHFEDGQRVSKGDPLYSIEATVLEAQLNEARANAAQSQAAFERAKELIRGKLISATDFDTARANYDVNVARLLSTQARAAKKVVRAPFDGFVGLRLMNVGDYADIGQELVSIVGLNPLRVDFSVPEVLLAQLMLGQEIEVSVGPYPGEIFVGTITAIAPQIDATGHSVIIRARLPNTDLKLRPGLFAQVSVTLGANSDALMIPEQAIWPIGVDKTVFVITDGTVQQRAVNIGQREDGQVEIVSGISVGDEIVTAGQMKLSDGAAVNSIPQTALTK